jgi:glucokinase
MGDVSPIKWRDRGLGKSARFIAVTATVLGIIASWWFLPGTHYQVAFLHWTKNLGPWAPVVIAFSYVIAAILLVPGSILTLASGFMFGIPVGVITSWIGASMGAFAAFLAGRTIARDWIARKVARNPRLGALDRAIGEQGFKIAILLRLNPVVPYGFLNYALAITRISFKDYAIASIFGMPLGDFLYVYIGSAARSLAEAASGKVEGKLAGGVLFWGGLLATAVITVFATRLAMKSLEQAEAGESSVEDGTADSATAIEPSVGVPPEDKHSKELVSNEHPEDRTNPEPAEIIRKRFMPERIFMDALLRPGCTPASSVVLSCILTAGAPYCSIRGNRMQNPELEIVLAGDIGGTKTNLGLFQRDEKRPKLLAKGSYSSPKAKSLNEMLSDFIARNPCQIRSACFGIAGPVLHGRCRVTNLAWEVSEEEVRNGFKWENVRLINDLAATAHAIPFLDTAEFATLNTASEDENGPVGIVAPGTGLGIALVQIINGEAYPISSEGGHVDFAPRDDRQVELWKYLHTVYEHISIERVASGPGIHSIYSWLKESRRYSEPQWLTERLKDEDPSAAISQAALIEKEQLCVETLDLFASILGSAAGNLALTGMTTGGVYLGGGIPPRILPKLREGGFMRAFMSKGRFRDLLSRIPVHVILTNMAALFGAAECAFARK